MSRHRMTLLAVALAGILALPACGGGSSSSPTPVPTPIPNANVAGNYTLTLTLDASTACPNLADEDKVKTYEATITQTGTDFAVNIVGNVDVSNRTTGTVSGNTVSLDVFISESRETREFEGYTLAGSGTGTVAGGNITGTVNGLLIFWPEDYVNVTCGRYSKFTFTKR